MMKGMGNLKWMAGAAAVMILLLSVPTTTEAGRRYSGMDPVVMVEDHKFNISIEWPSNFDCNITGPVEVRMYLPVGMDYEFEGESASGHGDCNQQTSTKIIESERMGEDFIAIGAMVPADKRFQVQVKVEVEGYLVREYDGVSNNWVRGNWISMKEVHFIDEHLDSSGSSDELVYTYDVSETRDVLYREAYYVSTYTD